MTAEIIPFRKPFKLAPRHSVDPDIIAEWVAQAREWKNDPDATDQQRDLASAVIQQWGTE